MGNGRIELLRVENFSCGYEGKKVVDNISFSVREGEFLVIIGPNGSGKTTLLRGLMQIIKPMKDGLVLYRGKEIFYMKRKEIAREIALLPQAVETSFNFSVDDFVLLGRYPHLGPFGYYSEDDFKIAQESMVATNTLHLRKRSISELSGGERQRVFIAQVLAQKPKIVLLDEPLTNLDIRFQVEVLDLLSTLNKNGLTVVLVLHDLNLASEYGERLILLDNGKIFREGKPEDVLDYRVIEEVYKTLVIVKTNPLSNKPIVFLVSKAVREKTKGQIESNIK